MRARAAGYLFLGWFVSGCASSIDFPLDPVRENGNPGTQESAHPERRGVSFERGFVGGNILSRTLFIASLPFEALSYANAIEKRIVQDVYEEHRKFEDDPAGRRIAERDRIRQLLDAPSAADRMRGLSELVGRFSDEHYYSVLVLLDDPHPHVRYMAMEVLSGHWKEIDFPRLVNRLSDSDPHNRVAAIARMTEFPGNLSVPALVLHLAGEARGPVRAATVEALAAFPAEVRALAALVGLLEDRDPAIRETSFVALSRIAGDGLGFDPFAMEEERAPAVDRWRAWLEGAAHGGR